MPLSNTVHGETQAAVVKSPVVSEEEGKLLAHLSVGAWGIVPAIYHGYGDEDAALWYF